jgi:hypothetical protein
MSKISKNLLFGAMIVLVIGLAVMAPKVPSPVQGAIQHPINSEYTRDSLPNNLLRSPALLGPSCYTYWCYDTKEDWNALWEIGGEGDTGYPNTRREVQVNYHRWAVKSFDRGHADNIVNGTGWNLETNVVVLHPGMGWILEALEEQGVPSAIGFTTSPYIQSAKFTSEDQDMLDAMSTAGLISSTAEGIAVYTKLHDVGEPRSEKAVQLLNVDIADANAASSAIKDTFGAKGKFQVLTYWLLSSMSDAEVTTLVGNIDALKPETVVHLTYIRETGWNDHSLEEWQALVPNHWIVSARSGCVYAPSDPNPTVPGCTEPR